MRKYAIFVTFLFLRKRKSKGDSWLQLLTYVWVEKCSPECCHDDFIPDKLKMFEWGFWVIELEISLYASVSRIGKNLLELEWGFIILGAYKQYLGSFKMPQCPHPTQEWNLGFGRVESGRVGFMGPPMCGSFPRPYTECPALGLMLCRSVLKLLSNFWTKGPSNYVVGPGAGH